MPYQSYCSLDYNTCPTNHVVVPAYLPDIGAFTRVTNFHWCYKHSQGLQRFTVTRLSLGSHTFTGVTYFHWGKHIWGGAICTMLGTIDYGMCIACLDTTGTRWSLWNKMLHNLHQLGLSVDMDNLVKCINCLNIIGVMSHFG